MMLVCIIHGVEGTPIMNVNIVENKSQFQDETVLKTVEIAPNLYAYHRKTLRYKLHGNTMGTYQRLKDFRYPHWDLSSVVTDDQGLLNTDNLNKMVLGEKFETLNLTILPLAMQETLRTKGWQIWQDESFSTWIPEKAFDAVTDPAFDLNTVVYIDRNNHMLFSYDNKPLPVGIVFGYIAGNVTDSRYDLKKLAAHLLSRTDCKIYKNDDLHGEIVPSTYANTVKEAIVDIPPYNARPGCRQTIYFVWQPAADDYARMWDWCVANNQTYPSTDMHRAVFELDLIGARAAGAALFDKFYQERR